MRPNSIFALLCALLISVYATPGFADDIISCDGPGSCPAGDSVLNGVPVDIDLLVSNMGTGDAGSDAFYADVAYNATDDEYLVVWRGYSVPDQVTNEGEIYAQRVSAAGVLLGANLQISDVGTALNASFSATKPSVAWSAADNLYLVVWEADAVVVNENEIYGQLLDNLGVETGPDDFRISDSGPASNALYDAVNADVVYNATDNEFLVAWEQDILQNEEEIVVRRVDTSGALLATEQLISSSGAPGDTNRDALDPSIAWNSKRNEYLVVWEADAGVTDNEFEIWGQRLDADVSLISSNFRISTQGNNNDATIDAEHAAVVFNPTANRYLVVWQGDESSAVGALEVWGQLVRPLGTLDGNPIQVSDTGPAGDTSWDAIDPDVAWNALNNQFMIVWEGSRIAGETEIFGQTLDGAGSLVGDPVRLSTSGTDGDTDAQATDPAVVFNANCDGFLMAWDGDPGINGRFEIHARLGQCTNCSDGIFGSTCASQCPGGADILACNANGTCDDGISGSGLCSCSPGFDGAGCDSCAANFYDYPGCNYCSAPTTCSGRGICDAAGSCVCDPGYSGEDCSIPATATVSVALIGKGSGTVTSSPPGIDCGDDCSEVYTYPTQVTLTATPSGGSSFTGFGGEAGCEDGVIQIASSGKGVNCTASFEQDCTTLALYPIATATGVKPSSDALQTCGFFTSSGGTCSVPSRDGFTGSYNAKCTDGAWSVTASPVAVECSATGYTGSTLDESCACDTGYVGCGWGLVSWQTPSAAACPLNASGAPACACDSNYRGILTWGTSSWSGSCLEVPAEMFENGFEGQSGGR